VGGTIIPETSPVRHRWWWLGVASAILIVTYLLRPSLTWRAEAWAEVATNFYHHARHSGWWDAIFAGDYGSLAWPMRLLSQLLVAVLGLDACFVWTIQMLAVASIAAACACLCLPVFDRFGVDVRSRALLAFAFGAGAIADYECYAAISAVYFAAIPMLAWSIGLFDHATTTAGAAWRGALIGLMMTGKVHLLVFAPLMGAALLWNLVVNRRTATVGPAIALVFAAIQVVEVLSFSPSVGGMVPDAHLMQMVIDAMAHATATWWHAIAGTHGGGFPWIIATLLVVAFIGVTAKWRPVDRWWLASLATLVLGTLLVAAVNARGCSYIPHHLSLASPIPEQIENRHIILMQMFTMMALVLLVGAWSSAALLPATAFLVVVAFLSKAGDPYPTPQDSPSDWFSTISHQPTAGAIPINPDGWWYMALGHAVVYQLDLPAVPFWTAPKDLPSAVTAVIVLAHEVRQQQAPVSLEITPPGGGSARLVPSITASGRIFQTFVLSGGLVPGSKVQLIGTNGRFLPLNRIAVVAKTSTPAR
jgi:hypothetical protein